MRIRLFVLSATLFLSACAAAPTSDRSDAVADKWNGDPRYDSGPDNPNSAYRRGAPPVPMGAF